VAGFFQELAAARLSGTLRFQAGTVWAGHSTASGSKASKHVFRESQSAGRNPQAADRKSLTAADCWLLDADCWPPAIRDPQPAADG